MAKPNPFAEEKLETREWHDRLGDSFWKGLHRSALFLEELDAKLSDKESTPCPGYETQATSMAQGLALIAALDHDDMLFLPPSLSLAAIHRGVSVEHYVGQWRGNLLDPGKGRLGPGNVVSSAFHLVPDVGRGAERLEHGIGAALAMRLRGHAKAVVMPMKLSELRSTATLGMLRLAKRNAVPLAFAVLDGDAADAAEACELRAVDCSGATVLDTLKAVKGGVDRVRSRSEAAVLYFSRATQQTSAFSEILYAILEKKHWLPEPNLLELVRGEIGYGIERARMIPLPPRNTVIQDVRALVSPELEAQWKEWRTVHGK